ncbi:MAG: thioredoxin family protein [Clostridia bacterium]|nr:thioredoxin family protein [Clostridia bacterium]
MEIQVIGMGCDKCDTLYKNTLEALDRLKVQADVRKVEDLVDIVRLGVMTAPSLMIDGRLVVSGSVASVDTVAGYIRRAMR